MPDTERVHIWSNGTEFMIWEDNNCDRCVKEPTCELVYGPGGIGEAFLGDGLLAATVAARMGHTGSAEFFCRERQTEGPVLPKPAAQEMAEAGAAMLPGLDEPRAAAAVGGQEA